jgi:DNA invertase Pin-like site-specific DNA recombinase
VVDEVDRLSQLVRDAQKLIERAEEAQEAFRVGDVTAASQTVSGMAKLLAQIKLEVDALHNELSPPSSSA